MNDDGDARHRSRAAWIRALGRSASIEQNPRTTLPMLIDILAERHEGAAALLDVDDSFSYRQLADRCHQYSRWGLSKDLRPGDAVALVMPNCAEYLAVWLGLSRLGVVVALINAQLSGNLLASAIRTAGATGVIVASSLAATLEDARSLLPAGLPCWVRGKAPEGLESLDAPLLACSTAAIEHVESASPLLNSTALYIYTSGTTGLPKAAKVSHYRVMQWSHWFAGLMDTGPSDRMYDCLPLSHSIGGIVAPCATLLGGGAVVIRARFSASDFWRDVRDERCTLFQYIGELCRYLVNAPDHVDEVRHSLRLACGNGLRAEVWQRFQERFRIPAILEYYASTEGNFSLYNCEGEPGAIGRIPGFLRHRLPVEIVRFDHAAGAPLRTAEGRCERCAPGDAGEAIGRIPGGGDGAAGRFEGYADAGATEGKILRDVFSIGDAWYRSGDLMRRDARGFYYFVDRIGDTYRWKGENVSTTEVLAVLTGIDGVSDGVVYGVSLPGVDGRAGMAALIVTPSFDLTVFHAALRRLLPAYARPLFLRLMPALPATATFKPVKQDLMRAGYDPRLCEDPLYVDSAALGAFAALDPAAHAAIVAGQQRF